MKNSDWNCVTSSPASTRLSSSSASACRVTTTLTRYSAAPIDSTASSALARKIRFESDDSISILLARYFGAGGAATLKLISTSPPSGTVTWRVSGSIVSFHSTSVWVPGGTPSMR